MLRRRRKLLRHRRCYRPYTPPSDGYYSKTCEYEYDKYGYPVTCTKYEYSDFYGEETNIINYDNAYDLKDISADYGLYCNWVRAAVGTEEIEK